MRVKKHLALLLAISMIVLLLFPTTTAMAASDYSYIKVKLSSMGSVTSVNFTVNGDYYIKENPYYGLVRGKTYSIKASGSGVALVDGSNSTYLGASATFVRCASSNSVNWLTVKNTKTGWTNYPGDMTFMRSSSYVTSICKLYMETYLVGVVGHEMSPSWPAEALKAQAVAARTYAMRYIYSGNTYDVVDTTSNQVYKGFDPSRDGPVIAAVNATKGLAMKYGSDFCDGVYSASNGGQIQPRAPRWGSTNTYHQLKDDPYDMKNPASPRFNFYFPKTITTSNTLEPKLKEMLLDTMSAKLGISKSSMTILGISQVVPYELPPPTKYGAYPAGSRKFQKVRVKVNYSTESGITVPVDPTPENPGQPTTGTVTLQSSSRLRIRSGPSTSYSIAGYVPNGGKVNISEQRSDGWLKITYNGINGYIYGIYVDIDPAPTPAPPAAEPTPTPAPTTVDKDGTVNGSGSAVGMREGASDSSSVILYMQDGSSLHVISKTHDNWLLVEHSSLQGYVKEDKVTYVEPSDPTPTPTPDPDATPAPTPVVTPEPTPAPPTHKQVEITLVFDDMQENFKSESSYLKYHSILEVYETSNKNTIVLQSGRFGHGIGLSQRGAQQMAKEGFSYRQILDFYYHGATIIDMKVNEQPLPVKANIPTTIGVVNCDSLNVRSGPGASYSRITSVAKGETVNVIIEDTWCKIYVPSKKVVGYVLKEFLNITHPEVTPTPEAPFEVHDGVYKVTASKLNMRSGPSTDYNVLCTLDNNELVTKHDASETFFKVKDNMGNVGWCSSKYLTLVSGPVTPTPPPAAKGKVEPGKKIYIRKDIGATSEGLATLENEAEFDITVDRNDGWLEITYNDINGFIEDDYVIFTGTKEDYYQAGTLTAADKLYASADTASNEIKAIPQDSKVWIIEDRDDGWVQVEFESEVGYVLDDNLDFTGTKEDITPKGQLTAEETMRDAASYDGQVLATIPTGTEVEILEDRDDGWVKIRFNNQEGYILDDNLNFDGTKEDIAPPAPKGQLTAEESLYDTPSTEGQVLATIPSGAQVEILEDRDDGWVKVKYNNQEGFVIDDNLDFDGTKEDHTTPPVAPKGQLTAEDKLYASPNTEAEVLETLANGTEVEILEDRDDGWVKVKHGEQEGYVIDDNLDFDGTKEDHTTPTPPANPKGTMTAEATLFASPSTVAQEVTILPNGAEVEILQDRDDGWVKVLYGEQEGYVIDDYLDFDGTKEDHVVAPPENPTGLLTAEDKLYASPSLESEVLATLSNGTEVKVLEDRNDGWVKVKHGEIEGYVIDDNLDFEGTKEDHTVTPTPTPEVTPTPTPEVTPTPTPEVTPTPTPEVTPTPTPEVTPTPAPKGTLAQEDKLYDVPHTYGEVLATIPSGSEVEVKEDRNDGWVKVDYDSKTGYILDDNLTFDGQKEETDSYRGPWAKVAAGTQIIYNEPSTDSYVLKYISEGHYVKLLEDRDDGFIKVDDETLVGYMVDDEMEFEGTKEDDSDNDPSELLGTVVASTGSVRLRKSPSLKSDILAYVAVNTQVVILEDRNDGWVYVNYNDLLGYMVDDFVDFDGTKEDHVDDSEPTPTTPPTTVVTGKIQLSSSSSRLRIRSSASTSASIIGHVSHNTSVKVLEQLSNGWMKIEHQGLTGYVSGKYVKVDAQSSTTIGTIKDCSQLNVRTGPDTSYSVLGQVNSGDKVTVLGSSNGWYKITYSGKEAWVSGKYVSVTTESTPGEVSGQGKVTASRLRVRSGAGLNYSQIGTLSKYTIVTVLGETNGFYKINYNGKTGYISKTYVQMT